MSRILSFRSYRARTQNFEFSSLDHRSYLVRTYIVGGHAARCQLTNYLGHLISFFLPTAIYLCSGSNCPKISRVYMLHSFFPGKGILMQGSGFGNPAIKHRCLMHAQLRGKSEGRSVGLELFFSGIFGRQLVSETLFY